MEGVQTQYPTLLEHFNKLPLEMKVETIATNLFLETDTPLNL